MMALSKCVLDRVEVRKNKFKYRVYGLVEIMSRSVFARMEKSTRVYKNIFDQAVDQVFDMFVHELNGAYGRDLESSLNQHINMGEQYDLGSEIEDDLLSISTFESETSSSSQQSHHKCIYRVKFYAEDGEEYYEEISEDRVEVIEVLDNDEIEEHFREDEAFGNDSILSENGQMDGDMSEDDQQFEYDEELAVDGQSGMTNSVSNLTTMIEINEENDEEDIALHRNEESSLYASSHLVGECRNDEVGEECDDDESEVEDLNEDVQHKTFAQNADLQVYLVSHTGELPHKDDKDDTSQVEVLDEQQIENDEELLMADDDHGKEHDQLNGIDQRSNIEGAQALDQLSGNIPSGPVVVPDMSETGKFVCKYCDKIYKKPSLLKVHIRTHTGERPFRCTWIECIDKGFTRKDYLQRHLESHIRKLDKLRTVDFVLNQSVPWPSPSHRHNTIPVFDSKSYSNEHQVTQLNKSSNQSSLDCPHNQLIPDTQQQTLQQPQHRQINLDQFNANPDLFNPNSAQSTSSNQTKSNLFPNQSVFTSLHQFRANLDHSSHNSNQFNAKPKFISNLSRISSTSPTQSYLEDINDNEKLGDDQLNVLEHRENIDGAESQGDQLVRNMPSGQSVVSDKSATGKYVCDHCGKGYKRQHELTVHIRTHTGERPFVCPYENCAKTFADIWKMRIHHMIHTGVRPHVCEQCGKTFRTKDQLTNHTRTHTGQRPYVCPYENCTKAFAQFGAMQTHHMIHTGERPYACNQCGKACRTASALTRHIRSHTGERPYKCPHCVMSFNQNSVLQTHLMIHTGERPHVCEQCRKSFRTKSDLKRHLNVHQRNPVEVNECAL